MNFLVDAQLPRRLALHLRALGHEAVHTLDLRSGNQTTDTEINNLSLQEQRIVIIKDADFVTSFLIYRKPYKLLLISTGNIKNADLESLLLQNLQEIITGFVQHDFLEMSRIGLITRQ